MAQSDFKDSGALEQIKQICSKARACSKCVFKKKLCPYASLSSEDLKRVERILEKENQQ
jgi:hypothetical protein